MQSIKVISVFISITSKPAVLITLIYPNVSNLYSKFINVIDDLKYINDSYDGDMVYVIGSDEVYIYMNEWIKISSYYGNI